MDNQPWRSPGEGPQHNGGGHGSLSVRSSVKVRGLANVYRMYLSLSVTHRVQFMALLLMVLAAVGAFGTGIGLMTAPFWIVSGTVFIPNTDPEVYVDLSGGLYSWGVSLTIGGDVENVNSSPDIMDARFNVCEFLIVDFYDFNETLVTYSYTLYPDVCEHWNSAAIKGVAAAVVGMVALCASWCLKKQVTQFTSMLVLILSVSAAVLAYVVRSDIAYITNAIQQNRSDIAYITNVIQQNFEAYPGGTGAGESMAMALFVCSSIVAGCAGLILFMLYVSSWSRTQPYSINQDGYVYQTPTAPKDRHTDCNGRAPLSEHSALIQD